MSEIKIPGAKPSSSNKGEVPGAKSAAAEQKAKQAALEAEANLPISRGSKELEVGPDYTYSKIRLRKRDEVNVYADEQDARYGLDPRLKKLVVVGVVLLAVFVCACIFPTQVFGRAQFSFALWLKETATGFQNLIGMFVNPDTMYGTYVFTIVVTLFAGAALGLSGGIFQGSLKNALASPSTLGVTSGGSIGAVFYALFVYPNSAGVDFEGRYTELVDYYGSLSPLQLFMENFGSFFCSLVGCALIVALIMLIAFAFGRGKVNNVALIVAGQVFTTLIALILSWVRMWLYNHGDVNMSNYLLQYQVTSFQGAYTLGNTLVFVIPMVACFVVCFMLSGKLSLLAFKDEEARSMGISTTRTRNTMVAICTIMTALVVSFCGMIGFVGFLVPHIARKLVGPDFRYLLPACALLGAVLTTAVYYICQLGIPYLYSGATGVVTSIIGCVAFLIIALRGRRSSGGEWL